MGVIFMREKVYNRIATIEYAKKWAYRRNPNYYNYDNIGGDCTNFVSQCIYAGSKIMNYDRYGWYYNDANNKSASWTGVEYLYKFLINNRSIGPYGKEAKIEELEIGDIIQLSFDGKIFGHTLLVVQEMNKENPIFEQKNILVATHTFDSYGRGILSYNFDKMRCIHIDAVKFL